VTKRTCKRRSVDLLTQLAADIGNNLDIIRRIRKLESVKPFTGPYFATSELYCCFINKNWSFGLGKESGALLPFLDFKNFVEKL
jgi:hypothetical protein